MVEKIFPKFENIRLFLKNYYVKHKVSIIVITLIFSFILVFFWNNIVISIDSGCVGVKWNRFTGTVMYRTYGEGLHIIPPWDKMYIYSLRIQNVNDSMNILTQNGLTINLQFSYRYYLTQDSVPSLHIKLGPNYEDKYVRALARSSAISVIGNYPPEKIYTISTVLVQTIIKLFLVREFFKYNIVLENFLITRISLPQKIVDAIESKLSKEQLSLEYNYLIDVEKKEKIRKQIEAQGIKIFQDTSRISAIKWRGLSVTGELAKSPNSKIIIIGTGKNELPVILNAEGK